MMLMDGKLSFEREKNGTSLIVLVVERKEDVNEMTLDMVEAGLDVLYEPRSRDGRYESCVICNEKTGIKMIAYQE